MNTRRDTTIFQNADNTEKVIFNGHTFFSIIRGCMIKYAELSLHEAESLMSKSYLADLPRTYEDVLFLSHETEFHWAMIITYGEGYWQKPGYDKLSVLPEGYLEWERSFIAANNLADLSFDFL